MRNTILHDTIQKPTIDYQHPSVSFLYLPPGKGRVWKRQYKFKKNNKATLPTSRQANSHDFYFDEIKKEKR
ncbi:MAG: hypothetical protein ACMG51_05160 [Ginsengibacter sp.]